MSSDVSKLPESFLRPLQKARDARISRTEELELRRLAQQLPAEHRSAAWRALADAFLTDHGAIRSAIDGAGGQPSADEHRALGELSRKVAEYHGKALTAEIATKRG